MNLALICPVCGQSFVLPAAACGGNVQCPRCSTTMAAPPLSAVPPTAPAVVIDAPRVVRPAAMHSREYRSAAVVVFLLVVALALLPVVYIIVGGALRN